MLLHNLDSVRLVVGPAAEDFRLDDEAAEGVRIGRAGIGEDGTGTC